MFRDDGEREEVVGERGTENQREREGEKWLRNAELKVY
jgi:hypothetical protein